MARVSLSFLIMNLLLAFSVVSFIYVVFSFTGFVFTVEMFVLLIVILMLTLGMYNILRERRWGWTIITVMLILMIINIAMIFLATRTISRPFAIAFLFSFVGFIIAFFNIKGDLSSTDKPEIDAKYVKTAEYYDNPDKK